MATKRKGRALSQRHWYKPAGRQMNQALDLYQEMLENALEAFYKHMQDKQLKPSCFRGCTWCCHQVVLVSPLDALLLARHMLVFRRNEVNEAFIDKLSEHAEAQQTLGREEWFRRKIPCVFLENNDCAVYRVRPTMCRLYHVVSPAADCAPPTGISQVIDSGPVLTVVLDKSAELLGAMTGKPFIGMGSLPTLTILALSAFIHDDITKILQGVSVSARDPDGTRVDVEQLLFGGQK